MKKLVLTLAIMIFTTTAANAEFLGGFFYNNSITPGGGYNSVASAKTGTATCNNYFYIASTGDCSVRSAMRNGNIKILAGYDVHRKSILGFQKITVKAWGN